MDDGSEPGQSPVSEALAAFARAFAAELDRVRPALERMAEIANRPEVRAALEQARARRSLRDWRPCHCLCGRMHPADKGVCDMDAVTTRRFVSGLTGPVDVPLCAPCAVAQGLTELSGPSV